MWAMEEQRELVDMYITEIDYAGGSLLCTIVSVCLCDCLSDCLLSWSVNERCFFEDIGKK